MAERNYLPQFMDRGKAFSNARKPPGGDTNDIFGLEERQNERKVAIYADKRMKYAAAADNKFQKKWYETEDILSPMNSSSQKPRRSLSESRTKSDGPAIRTPPLATGKENAGYHFKRSLSPASKISSECKKLDKSEDEDEDETSMPKKQQGQNPISGDVLDNSVGQSKKEYSTDKDFEPVQVKETRRPCIRVRQPPGGKSSIIF